MLSPSPSPTPLVEDPVPPEDEFMNPIDQSDQVQYDAIDPNAIPLPFDPPPLTSNSSSHLNSEGFKGKDTTEIIELVSPGAAALVHNIASPPTQTVKRRYRALVSITNLSGPAIIADPSLRATIATGEAEERFVVLVGNGSRR